jgi:hypothetical protein
MPPRAIKVAKFFGRRRERTANNQAFLASYTIALKPLLPEVF